MEPFKVRDVVTGEVYTPGSVGVPMTLDTRQQDAEFLAGLQGSQRSQQTYGKLDAGAKDS